LSRAGDHGSFPRIIRAISQRTASCPRSSPCQGWTGLLGRTSSSTSGPSRPYRYSCRKVSGVGDPQVQYRCPIGQVGDWAKGAWRRRYWTPSAQAARLTEQALTTYECPCTTKSEREVDPKHPLKSIMIESFIFNVIGAMLLPKLPVALTHEDVALMLTSCLKTSLSVTCCIHSGRVHSSSPRAWGELRCWKRRWSDCACFDRPPRQNLNGSLT
jgi:hypothetical protein